MPRVQSKAATEESDVRQARYLRKDLRLTTRLLLPIVSLLRELAVKARLDPRLITCSWFFLTIAAYAHMLVGTPVAFLVSSLLLHFCTALDICDGEVGRRARGYLSPDRDAMCHLRGLYLDRVFHLIEKPISGLAVGTGAFLLTGELWMLPCGLAMSVFQGVARVDDMLRQHVMQIFRSTGKVLPKSQEPSPNVKSAWRLVEHFEFFFRNGKRFKLMLLVASITDVTCQAWTGQTFAIFSFVAVGGAVGVVGVVRRVLRVQFGYSLFADEITNKGTPSR